MVGDGAPFEEDVAKGVREADPDALAAVYLTLVRPLTAYVRAQVRDDHAAHEVVAETFGEFVRSCRTIRGGPFQIRAWLYRAARHNTLDHHRHRRRHPEDATEHLPDRHDDSHAVDDHAAVSDELARMREALASLPADQAQVLTLRFLGELSAPEVAAVMDKTEGAVRALQHRATAAMARKLRNQPVPAAAAPAPEQAT